MQLVFIHTTFARNSLLMFLFMFGSDFYCIERTTVTIDTDIIDS